MMFTAFRKAQGVMLGLACCALFTAAQGRSIAEDVAVFDIRIGEEKQLRRVVIEFYDREAPQTVANFKELVGKKFYDGTTFHRLFPQQMIQGGDPLSRKKERRKVGTGGPGYTLAPEPTSRRHGAGSVAMARLGDRVNPSRVNNGSQFYITLVPMPTLDGGKYTIFGRVSEGLEVVNEISSRPVDTNDSPLDRVVIERSVIAPKGSLPALAVPKRGFFSFFRR